MSRLKHRNRPPYSHPTIVGYLRLHLFHYLNTESIE